MLFSALVCAAQVNDDFSDGDLTNNPVWTPDAAGNWTVDNARLRSNSSMASSSFYITTPSTKALNAQWEFWVNLQFNTSSTNYVDVFLTSDQSNLLSTTNNGYFVRIGGTPDEISLYKIVSGTSTLLINGVDGITNSSNTTLRIKVIREGDLWTLERDATGGTNYFLEGSVTDNSVNNSNFFGIRIQQSTASFFNRHFFDSIYAGEIVLDTEAPILQQLQVTSINQLTLIFNEKVTALSAQDILHYSTSNGLGNPASAQLQVDEKTVVLTYSQNFGNGISNQLTITGVTDLHGNSIISYAQSFLYFQSTAIQYKDVILTEIFADPSPQIGLPNAEFVELFNRSANPVNLAELKFSDGSSTASLAFNILLPGEYRIITATGNVSSFNPLGQTVGASNFPTLNNEGEALTLKTSTGKLIDSVNYNTSWYRDDDKREGGWSLELIDATNLCGQENNWSSSEDVSGGTPGKINSINANKPDLTGPRLLSLVVTKPDELVLTFDEPIEKALSVSFFSISPELLITNAFFASISLREIKLKLNENLAERQLYVITINDLSDCNGNAIQENHNHFTFAVPEQGEAGDVVVNEILFNPYPGSVDFVEVFNVSEKFINLKNWSLANQNGSSIINKKEITSSDLICAPGSYLVFSTNPQAVISLYPGSIEENFFQTTLPSMNDDEGSIVLLQENDAVMDAFSYTDKFHNRLLKDKEGVSLERISFSEPTQNPNNWRSANASEGFATPGYLNSNTRPDSNDDNAITLDPEIFSPNRPGQDFTQIHFQFDQSGYVANINIADQQGRIIKRVANNETLGYQGFYRWDGDRDDGSKARIGYYFVWFEIFALDGTVKTYRKRVVIGG